MSKPNGKTEQQGQVQQQVETPVQQTPEQVQQQPQVVVVQQPQENWFKRHWKGVVGGVSAIAATAASAVVAYKKGKAAGIMAAPPAQREDYSLNPNE